MWLLMAGGVSAAEWLAATLDGGDVTAGGAGARTSAVDDGLCPALKRCDTSTSPSSYLLTVHNNDVDVTPLRSLQNAAPGGNSNSEDCDGVDCGVTHARLYDDAQSNNDDDKLADVLKAIQGHVGQYQDTGCDNDGVNVSVGVNVGAVVGVSVHGQGVNLGVCLVVSPPPRTFLDS